MEFQFGPVKVKKIFELDSIFLPLQQPFPQVTAEDLRELKEVYWNEVLSEDPQKAQLEMFLHSYVLQINGKNVLIDTCAGNHKDRGIPFFNQLETPYMANFAAAGLRPDDIDFVMCTHLHFDHVGWNTRLENGKWVPTFPRARYLFTRADFEYFDANRNDPMYGAAFCDSVLPIVEHGQAQLVETNHLFEHELDSNVWLQGVPGHSPGSSMVCAKTEGELLLFSGDTFHHPLQLLRPDMHFFGDDNPSLACTSRAKVFAEHADSTTVFFPAHFGGNSGGHIRRHKGTFRYDFLTPSPGRPGAAPV